MLALCPAAAESSAEFYLAPVPTQCWATQPALVQTGVWWFAQGVWWFVQTGVLYGGLPR